MGLQPGFGRRSIDGLSWAARAASSPSSRERVNVLGYDVSRLGLQESVARALAFLSRRCCASIVCANPHSLVVAAGDPPFAEALRTADLLLPDGTGIVVAGRLMGTPFAERVAGPDFFRAFSEQASRLGGVSYFFLGSNHQVLDRITARLAAEHPELRVAGSYAPPFKPEFAPEDDEQMLAAIRAARPDVLWVGMTAPKQEKWIARNRSRIDVPLVVAIGAAFDFYAGTRKRAPAWMCRLGLEWLPRLIREPRRLWRRNVVSTPLFLIRLMQQRLAAG
jgi:N-acetylglucosaminyldiphosphoundecaprenol N-acetyl-beta-D-mannosaminyltransferase